MSSSWSNGISIVVSTVRLFKAATINWHNLGPKIAPEIITSASVISGDGAAWSVRELKFISALPFSYIKARLDLVDHEKLEAKITHLGKTIESASTHFKFEPSSNGACIVNIVATYKILLGV